MKSSAPLPEAEEAKLSRALRDPAVCRALLARLEEALAGRELTFMEVCGTHTVAIYQSGLRSLLPANVKHLSGPGCPVCVTADSEAAMFLELAARPGVIIATFGDLLRVPGPDGTSLKHYMAKGADVRIVYSQLEALEIARANPDKKVIFLGVGFETTAPGAACAILRAAAEKLDNFLLLSMHKLAPPAIEMIVAAPDCGIDAFLLPGHVATVTGLAPFQFLADVWKKPGVVGGFEPADIMLALCAIAEQLRDGEPKIANVYKRAVDDAGNPKARGLVDEVFEVVPAVWRGLGEIPASGLAIRLEYRRFDAAAVLGLSAPRVAPPAGCKCGDILAGRLSPPQCPLFGKKCLPQNPVGPCMVSTEGSCAAHYRYGL